MLPLVHLVSLALVGVVDSSAIEARSKQSARFEDVKGPSPSSVSLSRHERAFVRSGKKVVVLRLTAVSREDTESFVTETSAYEWTVIDGARVESGVVESRIKYRVQPGADGNRALTVVEGDAGPMGGPGVALRVGGLQLSWSVGMKDAVWLYVPMWYSWAKLPDPEGP